MQKLVPATASALAILSLSLVTSSAYALRCGTDLVLVGDRAHEVREHCGEPVSVIATTDEVTTFASVGRYGRYGTAVTRSIAVETWLYDFGPTRFMEELRFENGVLVRMTTLGYGTRRSSIDRLPWRTRPVAIVPRRA